MNILILGRGWIGTQIYNHLKDDNTGRRRVAILGREDLNYCTNPDALTAYLKHNNIDYLINTVGYTGNPNVDDCERNKEQTYLLNVILPLQLEGCCMRALTKMIHIGSGCIYDAGCTQLFAGRQYSETETPNFGAFSSESSYYSRTKHISETLLDTTATTAIVRIRIPFNGTEHRKNYLTKLMQYDTLITNLNSKTSINGLNSFIGKFLNQFMAGIYNVVHDNPVDTRIIVDMLKARKLITITPRWITAAELKDEGKIQANRSNCVLDTEKINRLGLGIGNELKEIERAIYSLDRTVSFKKSDEYKIMQGLADKLADKYV